MPKNPLESHSRRDWLALVSAPALAAAVPAIFAQTSPAAAPPAPSALAGARIFNVHDFGARGDGKTLDTAAIQAAIDACTADHGGTVVIPAGEFVIGPIELKSNVTLHICAGGTLLGSTDPNQYHPANGIPISGDHTMPDGNTGLVYAANASNVTLEGPGTIDGRGTELRDAGLTGRRRAHLTLFYKCTNLTIRDIYLYHSEYHTCRICNSSYVNLDGIRIFCRIVGNNDGFHFISAEHVAMTNCHVRSQDDACAIFGSCKFMTITNCFFSTRWSVFRFGSGICNNISVSNCVLYQVYGCPIKIHGEPGSQFENFSFSNLVLQEVTGPIYIGSGPKPPRNRNPATAPRPPAEANPPRESELPKFTGIYANWTGGIVKNISFSNISGTITSQGLPLDDSDFSGSNNPGERHACIILHAVDGMYLENISLSNIHLTFGGGGTAEEAARRDLPQFAGEYFSLGPMPAYGLYARNVHGLTLSDLRFQVAAPDLRPALIFDKVQDAAVFGIAIQADPKAQSALLLINSADVLITSPRLLTPTDVFLRIEGEQTRNITVEWGDISKAASPVTLTAGAKNSAFRLRA